MAEIRNCEAANAGVGQVGVDAGFPSIVEGANVGAGFARSGGRICLESGETEGSVVNAGFGFMDELFDGGIGEFGVCAYAGRFFLRHETLHDKRERLKARRNSRCAILLGRCVKCQRR